MDLFIIAGQSNASGRGLLSSVPTFAYRDRVKTWHNNGTGFAPANEPMDSDQGGAQYSVLADTATAGAGVSFGDKYAELRPSAVVGLIPASKGGTSIAAWSRNLATTSLYGAMIARANAALAAAPAGSRIAGFIWYQGESDTTSSALRNAWDEAFTQLVADVRSDLSLPTLPVIMTILSPTPSPLGVYTEWVSFVSQQTSMTLPSDTYRVTANDLTKQSAGDVHIDTASYITLGQRWAAQMDAVVP